ncbi:MAG TPA: hypothetical protein DCZ69_06150 [Syntrophobacteraceae bacterium]|nr:hypothetical protein [Syntrophobacteraceae bacterium]
MNSLQKIWTVALIRAAVVAGSGILLGYLLYQSLVFTPAMVAFQFTLSGVTAGVAYAALKGRRVRDGLASLVVWYVIVTFLVENFVPWMLLLNFIYIAEIAVVIWVYVRLIREPLLKSIPARIVLAGALLSMANRLLIVILETILKRHTLGNVGELWELIMRNCQFGALIGLAVGCGIEIAEQIVKKVSPRL